MKFALASFGTRGDIEPSVAVGRELLRRGHDVRIAVPPNLVSFVESTGLTAVAYGLDTPDGLQEGLEANREFWTLIFHKFWKLDELRAAWHGLWDPVAELWVHMNTTLKSLAQDADLLLTGLNFEQAAANVAEYYDIPFATLHFFPIRPNGQLIGTLPPPLIRFGMTAMGLATWHLLTKKLDDLQRRELGLPKAKGTSWRRLAESGALEIQAYDEICFPGLAAEWAKWNGQRPFVGPLTMELTTGADDEVASWIAADKPPICFGFGSFAVESPSATVEMIASACAELGERALICSGWTDFRDVPHFEHVKVVGAVNYAATFPACRAVVHHGGAGTTAASLRAGVPTLILWTMPDQPIWGAQFKRLKVGTSRRFSTTTRESLVADLRQILAPDYAIRARELAGRMTKPAETISNTADLVENFARSRRFS
ncbi:glycosyltransferase [Mycobacterium sp. 852002-40037_SCH5390672]|uniref:glycosyltransferase n=1 Tax=Mycobacterium sp. 852002-40037_SCH5390672 TaxID=1834089 RepID=UPI000805286A|nr:glycosyltransferase [Mycobacterium sp. 852002-40037_SCH5390672]OBB91088.1 glycosyl transferase family 1 [Mycobacterium sp. 852002-40037_SCH5390672]